MDAQEQRAAGLRMAIAAKALKTKAAIKDVDSCYEDIFKAAIADVGLNETVARVLEGDPEWASQMLATIPDLGNHREALLHKAAESPGSALQALRNVADLGDARQTILAAATPQVASIASVSAFSLKDSAGFNCSFTLYWENDGKLQPLTGNPNKNHMVWSPTLMLGQSTTVACRNFSLTEAPLQDGDTIWMFVSVHSGSKHNESKLRFTYDSSTIQCADFVISGTTTDNTLAYSGLSNAAPIVKVSISGGTATCSPDTVDVHRKSQTGIQWVMETEGYQFTGISVTGNNTSDFSEPVITNNGTVMVVTDTVEDLEEYSYTVEYKAADGTAGSFDPGIRNRH